MLNQTTFTAELDLKFFEQREFEPMDGISLSQQIPIIARNVLRVLMMGWTDSWKELVTPTVAYSVFVERNPEFLREIRRAFQQGFFALFKQLEGKNLTEGQAEQVQLYLSNCLSLLPYSDLTPYESIRIPQYLGGKWQLVEYVVKPIELTKGTERDADRVFAYGLEPLIKIEAESHLIFMGTTYPAGQGFVTQINSDTRGFESVGSSLYKTGRERIQAWLALQHNAVHVCGTSLGGSLSLLLAIDKGNYELSRVDALNSAGLHEEHATNKMDHWNTLYSKPRVVIQKQGDDPVSYFGFWKDDWEIVEVKPPKMKQGPNSVTDHALNYAGLKGAQFTFINANEDNAKRSSRNFWIFSITRSALYYTVIAPYIHVIRPTGYFFARNWPFLFLMPIIALALQFTSIGGLPALGIGAAVTGLVLLGMEIILRAFNSAPKHSYAKIHAPSLPRNHELDIYSQEHSLVVDLTYQYVNVYYHLMRIAKKKELLPSDNRPSKHVEGITKRELLKKASENLLNADVKVPFHLTKAKLLQMRHAFTLFNKIGYKDQEQLAKALAVNYDAYRIGKNTSDSHDLVQKQVI